MTADLKIARIYVTTLDPENFAQQTAPGLKSAVGFIRKKWADGLIFAIPLKLSFIVIRVQNMAIG